MCACTNRLFAVTASMCERNRGSGAVFELGMGEPEESGGGSFMGVSLADTGQIIGFSQREGKCV